MKRREFLKGLAAVPAAAALPAAATVVDGMTFYSDTVVIDQMRHTGPVDLRREARNQLHEYFSERFDEQWREIIGTEPPARAAA